MIYCLHDNGSTAWGQPVMLNHKKIQNYDEFLKGFSYDMYPYKLGLMEISSFKLSTLDDIYDEIRLYDEIILYEIKE